MAEVTPVEPEKIYAIVVGLEWYVHQPGWQIHGAARDALRFAAWLRFGNVPPKNIQLLVTVAPGNVDMAKEAADLGLTPIVPNSFSDVVRAFTEDRDQPTGELLYVYWGGHGLSDDSDGRLLLTPDATVSHPWCIRLDELRRSLSRNTRLGFTRQILFFDACATFFEEHVVSSSRVGVLPNYPGDGAVDQFSLFACREGEVAEHDPAAKTGVFSDFLVRWLEQRAADLDPDLEALTAAARDYFVERYGPGAPRQHPVYFHAVGPAGGEKRLFRPWIDPHDVSRVVDAVHVAVPESDRRLDYARTLFPYLQNGHEAERFAEGLLAVPRALARLIEFLRFGSPAAADRLVALYRDLGTKLELLSYAELVELRTIMSTIEAMSAARVTDLLHDICGVAVDLPVLVGDVTGTQLVDHVERFEQYRLGADHSGVGTPTAPLLLRFTERLAAARPEIRDKLRGWGQRLATRLGLWPGVLSECRDAAMKWEDAPLAEGRPVRLVVQLFPDRQDRHGPDDTFACAVWSGKRNSDSWEWRQVYEDPDRKLSNAEVGRLIDDYAVRLEPDLVEIMLPITVLPWIDLALWGTESEGIPCFLPAKINMALRCESFSGMAGEGYKRRLKKRWSHRAESGFTEIIEHNGTDVDSTLLRNLKSARAVLRVRRKYRSLPLKMVLQYGYPVVLWDVKATGPLKRGHFEATDPGNPDVVGIDPGSNVRALPEQVREYWVATRHSGRRAAHPARPALLLEDPDRPLPEPLPINAP